MKLNEVKQMNEMSFISKLNADGFLTSRIDIAQWCEKQAGIPGGSYTMSKIDGRVDVHVSVTIKVDVMFEKGMLHCPVQFGEIEGDFTVDDVDWTSMKGLPSVVYGYIDLWLMKRVHSFEFAPKETDGPWYRLPSKLTSLVGIEDRIKKLDGKLFIESRPIVEGGIGILLIEGIKSLHTTEGKPFTPPFQIIEKYVGRPDDIYECQAELIDNGFEKYAKL